MSEVPESHKDEYWLAVTKCLVKFAGQAEADAKKASDDFRKYLEGALSVKEMDLSYHEEAFAAAQNIAEVHHGWTWAPPNRDDYVKEYVNDILGI